MKILRIYTKLPPLSGGMEKHIRYLTEYQLSAGHEVTVFFNQGEKVSIDDVRIMGHLALHRIRPQFLGILIFYFVIFCYLILKKHRFDVLHIHGDWSSLILAGPLKRLTGSRKIVFSFHGAAEFYSNFKKYLLKKTVAKTNLVFCTGYNSFELLKSHPGAIFQPSGIDPVFFDLPRVRKNKKPTVITVARLEKVKNPEAVVQIAKRIPGIDFILTGDGSERQKLEKIIATESIKNVIMTGQLDKWQVAGQLNKAHIFLLTSVEEGTPTAVLEAMAAGLALVVSGAGGIAAVVQNGKNGFIIDHPFDIGTYTQAIQDLIDDPSGMAKMQEENKNEAEKFRWSSVGESVTQRMIHG